MKTRRILLNISFVIFFINCSDIFNTNQTIPENLNGVTLFPPINELIYATGFDLRWSREESDCFLAYKIYIATEPGITENCPFFHTVLLRNDTSFLINGLEPHTTYFAKIFVYSNTSYKASLEISVTTATCSCGVFTGEVEEGMVLIPGGSYQDRDSIIADISYDYYMDMTEVTEAEWDSVMGDSSSTLQNPKTGITWYAILLYCNKRSAMTQRDTCYTYSEIEYTDNKIEDMRNLNCDFTANGYRLPTEDEWEYAYRAGTHTDYFWGKNYGTTVTQSGDTIIYPSTKDDTLEMRSYGWCSYDLVDTVQTVAQKTQNPWHLFDIAGNVDEFTWDWYASRPTTGRINYAGPHTGTYKIKRGGSWQKGAYALTAFYRTLQQPDEENTNTGFRTVRTKCN